MISSTILNRKNTFIRKDGTEIVDLTKASIKFYEEPPFAKSVLVTEDIQMRSDLIAYSVLGDDSKFDYVLKYNGISNPYSIYEGEVLYVPVADEFENHLITPRIDEADLKATESQVEEIELQTDLIKDPKSKDKREAIANKRKQNLLPPNVNRPYEENVKFKDGKIIFGEDISGIADKDCTQPLARHRVIQKLLQNKIR
jgi:hypothetical protein